MSRVIGILLACLTALLFVAVIVIGMVGIWTGDDRWAQTAVILVLALFVCGVASGVIFGVRAERY